MNRYDLIVVGSGGAGIMAAITAAKDGKNVLLLEKLSTLGAKLKATGGGKCNLTNTLCIEDFIDRFGRDGRFMIDALKLFSQKDLREFFDDIGVKTDAPDGFRVFPSTHSSLTIIKALEKELFSRGVKILFNQKVKSLLFADQKIQGVKSETQNFEADHVIIATGGLGYPSLGAHGDGYTLAKEAGHTITSLYPAMLPLHTKESWVANCRADTIANATIHINLPKAKRYKAKGDLIFTKKGIRGPVILDFAREITPFLEKYDEVPLLVNMIKGMNEDSLYHYLQNQKNDSLQKQLSSLLPQSVIIELCKLCDIDPEQRFSKLSGAKRQDLLKIVSQTPLTVIGHDGFEKAMITRGGISLKEISPKSMQSKKIKGLYFCGELMNIDGPCGGYNLQWSFSSGYLAGKLYSI